MNPNNKKNDSRFHHAVDSSMMCKPKRRPSVECGHAAAICRPAYPPHQHGENNEFQHVVPHRPARARGGLSVRGGGRVAGGGRVRALRRRDALPDAARRPDRRAARHPAIHARVRRLGRQPVHAVMGRRAADRQRRDGRSARQDRDVGHRLSREGRRRGGIIRRRGRPTADAGVLERRRAEGRVSDRDRHVQPHARRFRHRRRVAAGFGRRRAQLPGGRATASRLRGQRQAAARDAHAAGDAHGPRAGWPERAERGAREQRDARRGEHHDDGLRPVRHRHGRGRDQRRAGPLLAARHRVQVGRQAADRRAIEAARRRDADDRRERRRGRDLHARERAERADDGREQQLRLRRHLVDHARQGMRRQLAVRVADLLGRRAAAVRVLVGLQATGRPLGRGRHPGPELRRRLGRRRQAPAGCAVVGHAGLYGGRDGHVPGHDLSGPMVDAGRHSGAGVGVEARRRQRAGLVIDDRVSGRRVRDVSGREVLREMVDAGRRAKRGRPLGASVTEAAGPRVLAR
ncbi:glycosyl hydrolase family protein [Burkholderia pseudomallei MSHR1043]|nr:glycosyl hydrolase family protein [Burkholderia pseudomallei MSHR1043]